MEKFNSFNQLPGGSRETVLPEPEVVKKEKHIEMLDRMGVNPEDESKISHKEFFDLAMEKCGYMGSDMRDSSRRVILMSVYQKAFVVYFGLKGSLALHKNAEFTKIFDKMSKQGEIDFVPHKKGLDMFLCTPRKKE